MASSKCTVDSCKRISSTLCNHCQCQLCTKHYMEHVKVANDQLLILSDELNTLVNKAQQYDFTQHAFEQIEQWREENHRRINQICDERKQQIKVELDPKVNDHMKSLRKLCQELKELIDEEDASFKQIEDIKNSVKQFRQHQKELETFEYISLSKIATNVGIKRFDDNLFMGGGTLLSMAHQLKLNEFYGKKEQRWMLIYKATRDGFSASDFHQRCDDQGPTMTIIRSSENPYLFGGYTSASWKTIGGYVRDPNEPFLFTLTNPHNIPPTKYSIQIEEYAAFHQTNCGPTFGGGYDLYICDDSQTNRKSFFGFPHSYTDTTNRGASTFTGVRRFQTHDIEVYRLMQIW